MGLLCELMAHVLKEQLGYPGITYLCHCCDQVAEKQHLGKDKFVLAYSVMAGLHGSMGFCLPPCGIL